MNRRKFMKTLPAVTALAGGASRLAGGTHDPSRALEPVILVKPGPEGGDSIMKALRNRKTIRDIGPEKLSPKLLSGLLWAAFGVNRGNAAFRKPGRTAPSASNSQEIDLYVALPEGVYLYEGVGHRLTPVVAGDFRARAGRRGAGTSPVNIFFVVDIAKYSKAPFQEPGLRDTEIQKSYYFVDTGLIAGNVYLFAASQGMAAWFHNCNKEDTAREFKLRPEQRVLFAQSVGYPA
jgi:hypothetical protein